MSRRIVERRVEVVDLPRQSQPSVNGFAENPIPTSPMSNTFLFQCVGSESPYGTTISERDARYTTGLSCPGRCK